jgi:GH24 family phage-related lysozyme (muramidase)
MAGGYGPPLLDFSPLGQLGKTFSDSYDEAEASKLLGRLMGSGGPRAPQPRSMSPLGASLVRSSTQQPVAENEADTQRMEASMVPGYNAGGRAPSFTGQPVQAASIIKSFEGYREKPYWDVNAHRVGYGSDTITDPSTGQVRQVQKDDRIDRSQAEADLARRVPEFQQRATQQAPSFARLPENVKAALTSVVYNYGSLPRSVAAAVETGDANAIASAVEGLGDHNGGVNRDRRMKEAAIIRGNPADLPAPGAQNAQGFAIPQGGGAPAAQDPEQRAMMGALLRNKHTRQVGLALWSDMRKGADVKMQDLGGAIGVFDSQGNLLRQIPKQAVPPAPTNDMREYDVARSQGFQGSLLDYQTALRKSGATNVNNNIGGDAIEPEFNKSTGKGIGERFAKIADEGDAGRIDLANVEQLRSLGGAINFRTMPALRAKIGEMGIKIGPDASELEAYKSIIDGLVPKQRVPGSGTSSDLDVKMFKSALPNLINTAEGNALIMDAMQAMGEDKIARAVIAERAMTGELKPSEAIKELRALPPPLLMFKEQIKGLPKGSAAPSPDLPASKAAEPPIRVTSPEQARTLPSGTVFIAPDGTTRKVP